MQNKIETNTVPYDFKQIVITIKPSGHYHVAGMSSERVEETHMCQPTIIHAVLDAMLPLLKPTPDV